MNILMPDGTNISISDTDPLSPLCTAMGRVLSDYHWRMFCDAWLAIGLAAELVFVRSDTLCYSDVMNPEKTARETLAKEIGRTLRRTNKR